VIRDEGTGADMLVRGIVRRSLRPALLIAVLISATANLLQTVIDAALYNGVAGLVFVPGNAHSRRFLRVVFEELNLQEH
jgi:hypothetical protein